MTEKNVKTHVRTLKFTRTVRDPSLDWAGDKAKWSKFRYREEPRRTHVLS